MDTPGSGMGDKKLLESSGDHRKYPGVKDHSCPHGNLPEGGDFRGFRLTDLPNSENIAGYFVATEKSVSCGTDAQNLRETNSVCFG